MQRHDDAAFMRRALTLAERGRRTVLPNPMVGCVLVRDGEVVGEGWHQRAGAPHAEVLAIRAAGHRARGADAYVTLEPCAHTGRTPPCVDAVIAAGIRRVVVAVADPTPLAAGGAERLRAAGVRVDLGPCGDEAARLNEVYLHGVANRRPFVVVKAAVSLDGRIAAADGTSQWLTGAPARRLAHRLRSDVDAVLVGSGTVLADDPQLTIREADGSVAAGRQPLRVVLDGRGRTPRQAHVLDDASPTLVFTAGDTDDAKLTAAGVQVEHVPAGPRGGLVLDAVLAALWGREVSSVLVEGGSSVASAFLHARLADKLVLHVAPVLLGDRGRPLLLGGPATLDDATRWRLTDVERSGDDAVLTYRPAEE